MFLQILTLSSGRRLRIAALCVGWILTVTVQAAQGEPFIDLYGGWSKGKNTDVSASQRTCSVLGCNSSVRATHSLAFESGASAGVRGGLWFNQLPWFGMAGDFSYFQSASRPMTIDSFALTATPMVRLQLFTTQDKPHGLVQPYIGAGPAVVVHSVSADFQPASSVALAGWSIGVGWTARAGLAVSLTDHIAFFSEWRLSQDRINLRQNGFFGLGDQGRLDMTQTTRHYLFGLSYRF